MEFICQAFLKIFNQSCIKKFFVIIISLCFAIICTKIINSPRILESE